MQKQNTIDVSNRSCSLSLAFIPCVSNEALWASTSFASHDTRRRPLLFGTSSTVSAFLQKRVGFVGRFVTGGLSTSLVEPCALSPFLSMSVRVHQQAHQRRVRGHRSQLPVVRPCAKSSSSRAVYSPHVVPTRESSGVSVAGCSTDVILANSGACCFVMMLMDSRSATPLHGARPCCARGVDMVIWTVSGMK